MKQLAALVVLVFAALPVQAEPVIKVISFSAEWCASCRVLNPAIENAISTFGAGEIGKVDLDYTNAHGRANEAARTAAIAAAADRAISHKAGYLIELFGSRTGLAILVASDTGEMLDCLDASLSEQAIGGRLQEALILTRTRQAGLRKPEDAPCPTA